LKPFPPCYIRSYEARKLLVRFTLKHYISWWVGAGDRYMSMTYLAHCSTLRQGGQPPPASTFNIGLDWIQCHGPLRLSLEIIEIDFKMGKNAHHWICTWSFAWSQCHECAAEIKYHQIR
jgi:hypothetical protein